MDFKYNRETGNIEVPLAQLLKEMPRDEVLAILEAIKLNRVAPYVEAGTYAKAVQLLNASENPNQPRYKKADGSEILRPLTFRETLKEKVDDFETLTDSEGNTRSMDDRLGLFKVYFDTCTGIGYKAESPKFKIETTSEPLILIPKNFNSSALNIDYSKMNGIELDREEAKYNELLTIKEATRHPAWIMAVEGDLKLLNAYSKIVFNSLEQEKAMGFWLRDTTSQDELRALCVGSLYDNSNAIGDVILSNVARLRLAHATSAEGATREK